MGKQLPKFRRILLPSPYGLNNPRTATRRDWVYTVFVHNKTILSGLLDPQAEGTTTFRNVSSTQLMVHSGTSQKNRIYSHTKHTHTVFRLRAVMMCGLLNVGAQRGPRAAATPVNYAYTCYINYTII